MPVWRRTLCRSEKCRSTSDLTPQRYDRWATLTRSLQPKIIEYGLATEAEIDIDTLEQRLREEAMAARAAIPLFSGLLVGQWARKVSSE